MSGQVQRSAGLVSVKKSDDVQAKVPLEPLDVRVGAVEHLGKGKTAHSADPSLGRHSNQKMKRRHIFGGSRPRSPRFHRYPTMYESWQLPHARGRYQLYETWRWETSQTFQDDVFANLIS